MDLLQHAHEFIRVQRELLQRESLRLESYHPDKVLARGYVIVRHKGSLLRNSSVKVGDTLEVESEFSKIKATVNNIEEKK